MVRLIQTAYAAGPLFLKLRALHRGITALLSVALLVSLLLLISTPDKALASTQGDLYRLAKAATVLIVGINDESNALSFGSGVFISEQGLIVTNAHVVEDSTRLFVYIRNQAVDSTAKVLAIDSDLDLAALRIQTDLPVPFLPLAKEVPEESTPTLCQMSYEWG
jgi:S1-C subfamily serine protease